MLTFLVKQKKETLLLRVTPDEGAVAQVTNLLRHDELLACVDRQRDSISESGERQDSLDSELNIRIRTSCSYHRIECRHGYKRNTNERKYQVSFTKV